jgi:hypothetical protein
MMLDISGDALKLLDHFIHYASLYPGRLADAMWYDADEFARRLRLLDKAFQEAGAVPVRRKVGSLKAQPPLPDDFDRRFPGQVGGKVREWVAYKSERGDFYSPIGLQNLLAQIDRKAKSYPAEAIVDLMSDCMANNWAGIIWDKIEPHAAQLGGGRGRRFTGREPPETGSIWNGLLQGDQN